VKVARHVSGRLSFLWQDCLPRDFVSGILRAEVFNMFVENAVEKNCSVGVTDSPSDASTFCTEASAGTFVVGTRE